MNLNGGKVRKVSILVFLLAICVTVAYAGEKCANMKAESGCCARAQAKTTSVSQGTVSETKPAAADPHAGCPAMQGAAAKEATAAAAPATEAAPAGAPAAEMQSAAAKGAGEMKIAEGSCPDVTGRAAINRFHENMHPMHVALEEDNYSEIRNLFPKLQETVKGVSDYKCPMADKCPPECLKDFESKKAGLLKAVDELGAACKGEDDARIDATFAVMHDAYIQFASMCKHPEPAKTEKAKVEETKQ
jgi:hypothetical protein